MTTMTRVNQERPKVGDRVRVWLKPCLVLPPTDYGTARLVAIGPDDRADLCWDSGIWTTSVPVDALEPITKVCAGCGGEHTDDDPVVQLPLWLGGSPLGNAQVWAHRSCYEHATADAPDDER